jgi:16S rRNA (uracil1498-N3)-methyltransferase
MKRFFIAPGEVKKASPVINGAEAHHISGVFRLKPRDHILLIDGTGIEYEAEIVMCAKTGVQVSILRQHQPSTESGGKITVGQGYLKDKKMDMLIRHLTEIGITRWIPVVTEFSVPNPDRKKTAARHERWEMIAREAVKQCGRTRVPEILPPLSFSEALETSRDTDIKMTFYEKETTPLAKTGAGIGGNPSHIFVFIGPEGGFSDREIAAAKAGGFISASLGPRILRAETASIAACTLIQHLFGDMH